MIAVGPGARDKDGQIVPTTVKAGDKVLLPGWGGNSIKLGEEVSVQKLVEICWFKKLNFQRSTSSSVTLKFWPKSGRSRGRGRGHVVYTRFQIHKKKK